MNNSDDNINYASVNWTDGMSINKSHFIQQENALLSQIYGIQSFGTFPFDYGVRFINSKGTIIERVDKTNQLDIIFNGVEAICPSGALIQLHEGTSLKLNPETVLQDGAVETFFLLLGVNPYKRKGIGEIAPNTIPPRRPDAGPDYHISLVPESEAFAQSPQDYFLPIARLKRVNESLHIEDYIPPCINFDSLPRLREFYDKCQKHFSTIQQSLLTIIQKIHEKEPNNVLAVIVKDVANQLLHYVNTQYALIQNIYRHRSPVHFLTAVSAMARILQNGLDVYQNKGREDLYNYLQQIAGINQQSLEGILAKSCSLDYNHTHLLISLEIIENQLELMDFLFEKLSEMEYIGFKNAPGMFIHEEPKKNNDLRGKFLDIN